MNTTLTWEEVERAARVGVRRNIEQMMKGAKDAHGYDDRDLAWQDHIVGALGECALAKMRDVPWGKGEVGAPDVDGDEVKTVRKAWHCLIVHKTTPDDQRCWLICNDDPHFRQYRVIGILKEARDGKLEEFWKDPTKKKRHAYFVPPSHLEKP